MGDNFSPLLTLAGAGIMIQQIDTELTRAQATTLFSLPRAIGLNVVTTAAVLTLCSAPCRTSPC